MGRFDRLAGIAGIIGLVLFSQGCAYWDADRRIAAIEAEGWNVVVKVDEEQQLDYLFLAAPQGQSLSDRYEVRVGPSSQGRDSVAIYRKAN